MAKIQGLLSWHAIDTADVAQSLIEDQKLLELAIRAARTNAEHLYRVGHTALLIAGACAVTDPDGTELCNALRVASEAFGAIFHLATGAGNVAFPLAGETVHLAATGPTGYTHPANWRTAFETAAICRRREALEALSRVPLSVFKDSSSKTDSAYFAYVEALSALWLRAEDTGLKLLAALNAVEPAKLQFIPEELALNVLAPELDLAFKLADGDQAGFNEALRFSIQRHKVYWSKASRKLDPTGYLALGPLALASLGHDAGMPVEGKSDFTPIGLLRGACK